MMSIPEDPKLAAARERKRMIEEERRERIFNARKRLIGIDEEALEKQLAEMKERREAEKREKEAFERQCLHHAQVGMLIERNIERERRRLSEEINKFRAEQQRPETRREFDLYDPEALKKARPPCEDDAEPCGLACAQRFAGEDEGGPARRRQQKLQQRAWLEQQREEARAAEAARREAERRYAEASRNRDALATDLGSLEERLRRQLDAATARYNRALAEEQEEERRRNHQREQEDNMADIQNCLNSDLLTENPDVAASNLGPERKVGSKFRGMSAEQKRAFIEGQRQQREERKLHREAEARRKREWDEMIMSTTRHAEMMSRDRIRKQKELDRQLLEQNKLLAEEQKAHQHHLQKFVFTNELSEEYYNQFNRSTR
ncbi:RIB43A-like with coiled-coils protein 2 [Schistocerca americana]|uniref:RIB43A-like with coiled-coils protein 2 n=1 Tax=Schistocerca americana TaxID=7009 RepID=UPI001F4F3A80|nr:RIB43A-like with coiled-coils protein 2 [Schistocerca americana]XP_049947781.1 RIB43A-like with coiled-coils protein 2 [Schistocerca serialis cubense]